MKILVLNCGSSSVKFDLFDWMAQKNLAKGLIERVGSMSASVHFNKPNQTPIIYQKELKDHTKAINEVFNLLVGDQGVLSNLNEIYAIGHRVVHGGEKFKKSTLIDDKVISTIKKLSSLAPLHNPPNLAGILATKELLPNVSQVAIFDTAFHSTIPDFAYVYALPFEWYEKYGIRRYGFHGSSHLYVSRRAAVMLDKHVKDANLITLHIGNGVSFSAIRSGISIDTSMGFTPLQGAVMGTRCGDIDPAIPLYMQEKLNLNANQMMDILNKKSGLLGITGKYYDRRDIISGAKVDINNIDEFDYEDLIGDIEHEHLSIFKKAEEGDPRCMLALQIEAYEIRKYLGSYFFALNGYLDAIVFTAGVGENSPLLRYMVLRKLENLGIVLDKEKNLKANSAAGEIAITKDYSKVKVFVIPTDEERVFIEDTVAVISGHYKSHISYEYTFQKKNYKPLK
ncbi:MAG: acetate kinase [Desulfurella sp.]|uniref:acetate kinase n=1 Tax=Desulfurella sp. TaxID=1962857 RepID=UPI003CB180D6